jgi:hypothetical protein
LRARTNTVISILSPRRMRTTGPRIILQCNRNNRRCVGSAYRRDAAAGLV